MPDDTQVFHRHSGRAPARQKAPIQKGRAREIELGHQFETPLLIVVSLSEKIVIIDHLYGYLFEKRLIISF